MKIKRTIGTRVNLTFAVTVIVIVAAVLPKFTHARPSTFVSGRQKRVSDQRVAELETLLALATMRGKLVTVPVGFGRVDPARIGRKRRSSGNTGIEKLRLLLQEAARDSESNSEEDSEERFYPFWNDLEDHRSLELTD